MAAALRYFNHAIDKIFIHKNIAADDSVVDNIKTYNLFIEINI